MELPHFHRVRTETLASLGVELQHYRHHTSGLEHIHLHSHHHQPHRSCLIALRTQPDNNKGTAHVLEHLALCGSAAFPVRDPFFMMLRRSMQTFMNAMTGADMTWYPFATRNAQDYRNLFRVYLDAVFRPRLDPLDFAQEAHRLSYNSDSDTWQRNGIVYNEMKGAMSDSDSILYQACCQYLMPDTIYQWNAGGDPQDIVQLTHQDVVEFHQRFYTPSNACIISYGDCDIEWMQQQMHTYCGDTPTLAAPMSAAARTQQRPQRAQETIAIPQDHDDTDDDEGETESENGGKGDTHEHFIYACLWADSADAEENILGDICEELLFGHAASPLRLALEQSGLCHSTAGSGFCDAARDGLFTIEAHGCSADNQDAIRTLIRETLQALADNGFSAQQRATAIHHVDLQRRYISGDNMPFGLELCEHVATAWNYDCDPLPHLDHNRCMENLDQRIHSHDFWTQLIRQRLLNNPHSIALYSASDAAYFSQRSHAETTLLARHVQQLPSTDHLHAAERALSQRQHNSEDQAHLLPRIDISDIPQQRLWPSVTNHAQRYTVAADCNGIAHYLLLIDVEHLHSNSDISAVAWCSSLIGDCGTTDMSYQAIAESIQSCAGSCDASVQAWSQAPLTQPAAQSPAQPLTASQPPIQRCIEIEMWGLNTHIPQWIDFVHHYLHNIVFNDSQRLRELLEECIQEKEEALVHSGHVYALHAASASLASINSIASDFHYSHGIGYLHFLKQLRTRSDHALSSFLQAQFTQHIGMPLHESLIGSIDTYSLDNTPQTLRDKPQNKRQEHAERQEDTPTPAPYQAYSIASDVHYLALVCPCPNTSIREAAALSVAATYMENTALHTCIREQGGAYGANAHFAHAYKRFSITSYRDPRLDDSFTDMHTALANMHTDTLTRDHIDQAIISIIADIDRPRSPAAEAKRAIFMDYSGWNQSYIHTYRQHIINMQAADIQHACMTYLKPALFQYAVLGNDTSITASQLPWERM